MKKHPILKREVQNIAIFMVVISGLVNITLSLPHTFGWFNTLGALYIRLLSDYIVVRGVLTTIVGVLLLLLSYKLYQRMRYAWYIEIVVLSISVILKLTRFQGQFTPFLFFELFIIAVLALSYKDFCRRSDRITVKWAVVLVLASLALVIFRTAVGLFILKNHYSHIKDFGNALYESLQLLVFMDVQSSEYLTEAGKLFARSAILLNWFFIISAVLFLLKPLVYNPIISRLDHERVRKLVLAFGQNPASYLALENDKKYYFGVSCEGVVAFSVVSNVAVCCGDLICGDGDAILLLSEFMTFCRQNAWDIVMLNVTDRFLNLYKKAGFACVKYGEDALFELGKYSLAGGRAAKVRAAINHATKEGIEVEEYCPLDSRDTKIEQEIEQISRLWLASKKNPEMAFMLGGIGLNNPMDRRYFIARQSGGRILGFVVFLPYDCARGYIAEVTRRRPDAPQGVLEKIIYTAFMKMKEEGVLWGSMGLSPLAGVGADESKGITKRLFSFVYENMNNMYGFKALHHAKEKYAPTEWKPRFMVYYPDLFTMPIAYTIVKVQNPKGISSFVRNKLRQRQKGQCGETDSDGKI